MAIQNIETKPPESSSAEELVINDLSSKATPVDNDITVMEDSADTFLKKKLSWSNIKAALKTYFDTFYAPGLTYVSTPASFTDETFENIYFDYDTPDLSFTGCTFLGVCYIKNIGGTITHTSSKGGIVITNGDPVPDLLGFYARDTSKF